MAPSPQQCGSRPADTTPRNRRSRSADPNTSQRTESKYRTLGPTGTSVANLALGTMGFGTETPEDEALTVIDAYVEAGGNVLDTSDVYGAGASETTLGRWFAARPRTSPTASFLRPRDGSESAPTSSAPRRAGVRQDGIRRQHRAARNDARDLCERATTGRGGRGGVLGVRQRAVGRRRDDRQGRHGRKAELRYPAGRRAKQLRTLRRIVPARTFDKQILKFNRLPGLTNWRRGSPQHLAELVF